MLISPPTAAREYPVSLPRSKRPTDTYKDSVAQPGLVPKVSGHNRNYPIEVQQLLGVFYGRASAIPDRAQSLLLTMLSDITAGGLGVWGTYGGTGN